MASPSKSFYAVVAGVGPGTGGAVAKRFAKAYPVILLARSEASYKSTVDEITQAGGRAVGISTDVSDAAAVKHALALTGAQVDALQLEPGAKLAAAVYNASVWVRKPFLELEKEDIERSMQGNTYGLFNFAQATLPGLLEAVDTAPHPPTLIVTGATASIRGSAKFAGFAAGKFAKRAIAQSLAREFGPQGVHVAHAIIDGGIDIPRLANDNSFNNGVEDGKISPDAIADSYWYLHTQPRSSFTQELDIRPFVEKF